MNYYLKKLTISGKLKLISISVLILSILSIISVVELSKMTSLQKLERDHIEYILRVKSLSKEYFNKIREGHFQEADTLLHKEANSSSEMGLVQLSKLALLQPKGLYEITIEAERFLFKVMGFGEAITQADNAIIQATNTVDILSKITENNFLKYKDTLSKSIILQEKTGILFAPIVKAASVFMSKLLGTLVFIFVFISLYCIYLVKKDILISINRFQTEIISFLKYINNETTNCVLCTESDDEIGYMAKSVNKSINSIKINKEKENNLINESIDVMNSFKYGDLSKRINNDSNTPSLNEIKNVINKMADTLESNVQNILKTLEEYSTHNYTTVVNQDGLKEHFLRLSTGVNLIGSSVTEMLTESKKNGLTLTKSSENLIGNMTILNSSSNQTAVSLEETSAALEEITSTIKNNSIHIIKMSQLSEEVKNLSKNGEKLSSDTAKSMDDINNKVIAISDAIDIIDQIAFQTNILSLNAAVEAATAGEAGKGFAVVAAEVRNLANKSAEAANTIKELVENATSRAESGKKISGKMIEGYALLNSTVNNTVELIDKISTSSKEQETAIVQVNDTVSNIDKQTQENANIASSTEEIAKDTENIASLILRDINNKKFK